MPRIERPTRTVGASEARASWSGLLDEVRQTRERVIIERSGIPAAVLISPADYDWLLRLEAQRDKDFEIVDRMADAFADVPYEEIEREAAKAVAEVRAEMDAKRETQSAAMSS